MTTPKTSSAPALVLIPRELAQSLCDYLKTRPWIEVAALMGPLLSAPAAKLQEDAPKSD